MSDATSQTVYFYNRHPISCDIILAKLRAGRGHLDGLRPEDLFPHDQDHYGGIAQPQTNWRKEHESKMDRV
jgi:sarcosine/dimethylglycine N-methyltransferase